MLGAHEEVAMNVIWVKISKFRVTWLKTKITKPMNLSVGFHRPVWGYVVGLPIISAGNSKHCPQSQSQEKTVCLRVNTDFWSRWCSWALPSNPAELLLQIKFTPKGWWQTTSDDLTEQPTFSPAMTAPWEFSFPSDAGDCRTHLAPWNMTIQAMWTFKINLLQSCLL